GRAAAVGTKRRPLTQVHVRVVEWFARVRHARSRAARRPPPPALRATSPSRGGEEKGVAHLFSRGGERAVTSRSLRRSNRSRFSPCARSRRCCRRYLP